MTANKLYIVLAVLLHCGGAAGQEVDLTQYDKVLVPVLVEPTQGAFGSLWVNEFRLHNDSTLDAVYDPVVCTLSACPPPETFAIPPGALLGPATAFGRPDDPPGRFFYVRKDTSDNVHFSLRVRDRNKQATTFGADVPIVRASSMHQGRLQLLSVPADPRFRIAVRVYAFDEGVTGPVVVRVFDPTGTLLGETVVPLSAGDTYRPPSGQVLALGNSFSTTAGVVRVELDAVDPQQQIWGFATVTNNETSQITVIVPD